MDRMSSERSTEIFEKEVAEILRGDVKKIRN